MGFFDSDWLGLKGQCPPTPCRCDSLRVKSSHGTLHWALPSRGSCFTETKVKWAKHKVFIKVEDQRLKLKQGKQNTNTQNWRLLDITQRLSHTHCSDSKHVWLYLLIQCWQHVAWSELPPSSLGRVRKLSLEDRIHRFSLMLIPNGFHPSEHYICDRVGKFIQVGSCWSPRKVSLLDNIFQLIALFLFCPSKSHRCT